MKRTKRIVFGAVMLLWLCLAFAALGETARVVTPGGKVNVRKAANEKARLVMSVPNKSLVEVVQAGDTWCKITYKRQTGYLKTEYLKLPSQLPGKKVYADEGAMLLREKAREDARVLTPVGCQESVTVEAVEGDWVQVHYGKQMGYVKVADLSYQRETPSGTAQWMWERGRVVKACQGRVAADDASQTVLSLDVGQQVKVAAVEGKYCLVAGDEGCAFAPTASICLVGPEDGEERFEDFSPVEAAGLAREELGKLYKGFDKEKLYHNVALQKQVAGFSGSHYWCGFFNDADQYVYGALVNTQNKNVVFAGRYTGFAALARERAALPSGEMRIDTSATSLEAGDVLDVSVQSWTDYQCVYTLYREDKKVLSTKPGQHFQAAYRPKEEGNYRLTVTVQDEGKKKVTQEVSFRVTAGEAYEAQEVYSQKDGWWKTVKYRQSNMEHSGCAIFALSHALARMGFTDSKILPQNLARTYALCLTMEGTNNERLITTAAKDFGFSTQRTLIEDQKQIVSLLKKGALFSFSVARGHIAMISGVSEDGEMVRVVDSAPQATYERIVNTSMYYQTRSGSFRAAIKLDDLPGARWYLDTEEYGGLEYWMPSGYAAKRGVRLIQPTGK